MTRFFFLLSFLVFSFSLQSQSIKKAYKLYEKGDLLKFKETLEKMDEKSVETSGKYFLYSLLYLQNLDNRDDIDSSYSYIIRSKDLFPNELTKEREELEELGIFMASLDSIKSVIDSLEFNFVKEINSISEYRKYMRDHRSSKFYDQAQRNWHTLEFEIASNINTWQSYLEFMKNFEDAEDFLLAKSLYEELLFKDKTSDRSLQSFEMFLNDNPETPYRDSLELMIFKFYGQSNDIKKIQRFISKYPNSVHLHYALNILYHSIDRDFSAFQNIELGKNFKDSLLAISKIDNENLLGVYEDDKIYFINEKGEKIISGQAELMNNNILCSFSDSDFFILEEDQNVKILNRQFNIIYSGPVANYIEDIGKGLIKILYDNGVDIVHKSGKIVYSGEYNDAYLVDDRFILFESEEKYSLYTFLGERVFDLIFYDVFQEGSFILFENEEGKLFVTTSDKLDEDILNLSPRANFIYDDYEYFDDNNILLFSEEKEELLNSEMNYIISPDPQLIEKNSFGWISSSDFGIRIVTDQLSIPFSTLYDDIIFSEKYFVGKRNDRWEVRDILKDSVLFDNIDSVSSIIDSVLWYRDEMKESILFPNAREIILDGNYSFNVLTPKFGTKKYIKIQTGEEDYIVDMNGIKLPAAEYYYTVEKGNTFSFLSKKFNISQSEIMKMNNKKNKRLLVGEKLKVRGYVPSAVISDSLFLIEFNGKKGISDTEGKIVLEPVYDGITNLSKDNIILIKDEKFGNYNYSDKKLISPQFSSVIQPIGDNYYKVKYGNLFGMIDQDGNQILGGTYDDIRYWSDSLFIVSENKRSSLFDTQSLEKIIDLVSYSFVSNENNDLILIQTEEGYGIYSSSYGEILIPAYNSIKSFNLNGRYYFLAKREISEANLVINLLINEKGEIILNQALNFNDLSLVSCD